ncbi:hypothetical protein HQ529_05335 [Candidatus Woesearchaeota archaeon]|nr:hypothetical protein [Candidatus Woesearchaeota archaeon]
MVEEYEDVVDADADESPEELLDDDEISPAEEGFMKGFAEAAEDKKEKQEDDDEEEELIE